jgi:hypothetical protein
MSSLHTAVAALLATTGRVVHHGRGPFEVTMPHTVWTLDVFGEDDTGGALANVALTLENVARDAAGASGIALCYVEADALDAALQRAHIVGTTGSSGLVTRSERSRVPDVDDEGVERLRTVYTFMWIDSD